MRTENVRRKTTSGRVMAQVLIFLLLLPLLLYLIAPIASLILRNSPSVWRAYVCCWATISALRLSLITASIALLITVLIGTPAAYCLSHYNFRWKSIVDTLIDLPLVLPPAAAGFALLLLFGKQGFGGWFDVQISFTMPAVIMAQVFVASPFYVKQARAGFEAVPEDLRRASETLGAGALRTFFKVTAPLAAPAVLAGAVMSWARALGEFGATLVFAGSFAGRTETMPIAIYTQSLTNLKAAIGLASVLVVVSFIVLLIARRLAGRAAQMIASQVP